jgi:hypothetical protein
MFDQNWETWRHSLSRAIFWQYNEGGINASWCISEGNHFHLLEKGLSYQKKQPCP